MEVEGLFAVVVAAERLEHFAVEADKSADSFAERVLELALGPEPVSFLASDIAVERTFAAAVCRSVAVACSSDFRKLFAVDERQLS